MSDVFEERVAMAMARLQQTQAAVARAEAELRGASTTVRSRDRAVEVTVGPQGELARLRFLDDKYRTMSAGQLAASVLEASQQGRAAMARRVRETFEPLNPSDDRAAGIPGFNTDWDRLFGSLQGDGNAAGRPPRGPRRARPAAGSLRDELNEDSES
jgi:DNA-binding protein YbaB